MLERRFGGEKDQEQQGICGNNMLMSGLLDRARCSFDVVNEMKDEETKYYFIVVARGTCVGGLAISGDGTD